MTLIRSHPEFKKKRCQYFYQYYNPMHKTLSEVTSRIRYVDTMCNNMNETTGKSISSEEMYYMILAKLNAPVDTFVLGEVHKQMDTMFRTYPPQVFSDETPGVLEALKDRGATLSILSNTGFTKGISLKPIVESLFPGIFTFQIYSDEIKCSKPHHWAFAKVRDMVHERYYLDKFTLPAPSEIIHVGDNSDADFQGARQFGFDAMVINSNDKLIKDLL